MCAYIGGSQDTIIEGYTTANILRPLLRGSYAILMLFFPLPVLAAYRSCRPSFLPSPVILATTCHSHHNLSFLLPVIFSARTSLMQQWASYSSNLRAEGFGARRELRERLRLISIVSGLNNGLDLLLWHFALPRLQCRLHPRAS